MKYIGVGKNVKVVIKSNEFVNFTERGIVFENVKFDERYEKIISNFHKQQIAFIAAEKIVELCPKGMVVKIW